MSRSISIVVLTLMTFVTAGGSAAAQDSGQPYLEDRGTGVPLSMFGTYIRRGELIVYPFLEHYADKDLEYAPADLGASGTEDYRGRYRANEQLLLAAYGITDNIAVEIEAAFIQATLYKSPADTSALPAALHESGLGDVEAQLRWRWRREEARRPELFSYGEIVFPHARDKPLIGTSGVELKLGTGVTRGFRWGTLTARGALNYDAASTSHFDVGEWALEYLKRLSPAWRVYAGVEGTQDEVSAITELQWHPSRYVTIKANMGRGLSSRATDWAPELGVLFTLPLTR